MVVFFCVFFCFFFFKQKTAYEMRISDWSSDVCSSDLSDDSRARVRANFAAANATALGDYSGSRAALYARLKLAGLEDAPEQFAVFAEDDPDQGHGLGRRTMPATLLYSTVCAVHTLWLAARAEGVGLR